MRGGFAPSLRRNATAEACNTAAPPGLVSPGGAATVGKRLPDGEMTFAIPVFIHPSNEYTMLWAGHPIPKNAPRRLGGALRTTGVAAPGCAITRLTRRWRAGCHKRRRLTDKPSTMPRQTTPRSIKPAPMREELSSLVIRNLPCLRWGACRRRFCAGMPEPCCLSARITPNGGLGLS